MKVRISKSELRKFVDEGKYKKLPDFIEVEATPVEGETCCDNCRCFCAGTPDEENHCGIHGCPCHKDKIPPGDCVYGCTSESHKCGRYPEKLPRLEEIFPDNGSTISTLEGRMFRAVNELIRRENARNGY